MLGYLLPVISVPKSYPSLWGSSVTWKEPQPFISLQGLELGLTCGMQNISRSALFSSGSICNITASRKQPSPWFHPAGSCQVPTARKALAVWNTTGSWKKQGAPANRTAKEAVVLTNKQLNSFYLSYWVDSQIFELHFPPLPHQNEEVLLCWHPHHCSLHIVIFTPYELCYQQKKIKFACSILAKSLSVYYAPFYQCLTVSTR